uniref:Radical SAM protein n=1 Tax=Candidatus Desulfatibia profunda TaxID=2841695 RepID=A0A8J6THS6_9BACT|nr:radical SAM protein [Candidatus Desulfatibia profunda]
MECAVITTYRCNARCGMCNTWQHPSKASEEFNPEILEKIPAGMKRLNITGGEPMLRKDIADIVRILDKKTDRLEISTNGYFYDRIEEIAKKFPNITIRVSVEGLPALNDRLRGIENGFDRAMRTILRLRNLGIKDIGFAMTISGENCHDLIDLYQLVSTMDIEFANAVVHNSFYFHKDDNRIENISEVEEKMLGFMQALLCSSRKNFKKRVKDWFRAYLNLGLLRHVQGKTRPIPCGAATDTFFLDPWGQILACNGSEKPLVMGDLKIHSFEDIWKSGEAEKVRATVKNCQQNCWMTGTAVPAMRKNPLAPIKWVASNKLRAIQGRDLQL